MIQFGRLLSFPATFKQLDPKLRNITLQGINVSEDNGNLLITSIANNHSVEILIIGNSLEVKAPTKIFCDCEFFKYNLAYGLYKAESLLHPENFILTQPKHKNPNLQLSGCKHIILTAQNLYQNRNFIYKNQ